MKPQKIKLSKEQRDKLRLALKKIIGQLNAIDLVLADDQVTDLTFNQLLATKGGITSVCKEIISKGVIPNLKKYSDEQIDHALNVIFRLN